MHIFLIRHGESMLNAGENYVKRIPDHLVPMTEDGHAQAREAGVWLAEYCRESSIDLSNARIWTSPHRRTRETAEEFNKALKIDDVREDITLVEQQYGLFDSVEKSRWGELYPVEFAEYQRQVNNTGKFYARLPLGESPFDVAVRVHQFMGSIHRDRDYEGVNTVFVFTHGATLRCFLLRWFHYSPEWYHAEDNPGNCWIREICEGEDRGYIYRT